MLISWRTGSISDFKAFILRALLLTLGGLYTLPIIILFYKLLWFSSRNNPSHIFESSTVFFTCTSYLSSTYVISPPWELVVAFIEKHGILPVLQAVIWNHRESRIPAHKWHGNGYFGKQIALTSLEACKFSQNTLCVQAQYAE